MKFVSLCLLAYKRPQMLRECLESLLANTDYPYELIVNSDTDNSGNSEYLFDLYKRGKISKLILTNGNNRGVGRSLANCIGVSEGSYICKLDTDLIFKPQWLSRAVSVLEQSNDVGVVGLFDYRNNDPRDTRFQVLEKREGCRIVNDLVSSAYLFRRGHLEIGGWQEDDGFHQKICQTYNLLPALTLEDLVINNGFGVYKSTYVSGTEEAPFKTPTTDHPLIFQGGTI